MSEKIKTYTFNFFTGYGIGEISPHTIRIYPISIKSFSFEDAVIKMKKKAKITLFLTLIVSPYPD